MSALSDPLLVGVLIGIVLTVTTGLAWVLFDAWLDRWHDDRLIRDLAEQRRREALQRAMEHQSNGRWL